MASNELVITLTLDDKASKDVAAALQNIGKESEDTAKTVNKNNDDAEKGTKKHKDALLKARDAVHDFHKEMFIVTAAIAAVSAATIEWATRNDQARTSIDNIVLAFKNGLAKVGQFFAPLTNAIGDLAAKFNEKVGGDVSDDFSKAQTAVKNFNDDLNKLAISFQAGQISAGQYFDSILQKQQSVLAINKEAQASLSELANLTAQVSNSAVLNAERQTNEQIGLLNEYKTNYMAAHAGMAAFTTTVSASIRTNMTSAFTSMITGAKTAKEAFTDMGKALVESIVEFMVQKLVAWVLEKTILRGVVQESTVAGTAVAAAWADAAAMVSLATLGANAIPAMAGIASTVALSQGLAQIGGGGGGGSGGGGADDISKYISVSSQMTGNGQEIANTGGFTQGSFAVGTSRVPKNMVADIHRDEGIIPADFMSSIRSGDLTLSGPGGGGGDVYITVNYPQFKNESDVRTLSETLGFDIQSRLRRARSNI